MSVPRLLEARVDIPKAIDTLFCMYIYIYMFSMLISMQYIKFLVSNS